MTLDKIRKVLEEKCLASAGGIMYTFNDKEIVFKTIYGIIEILNVQKIIIEEYNWSNNCGYLTFYHGNKWKYSISSSNIESISYVEYVEGNKIKLEAPHEETKEEISNKFYEELIKPFIIKVAKDIYKEIKNDRH